jgi:hypothetical protein
LFLRHWSRLKTLAKSKVPIICITPQKDIHT